MKQFVKFHYICLLGLVFILISLSLPSYFGPREIGLIKIVENLLLGQGRETVFIAILLHTSLQTLLLVPMYVGSVMIGEAMRNQFRKSMKWLPIIIIMFLHLILQLCVSWYNGITSITIILILIASILHKARFSLRLKLFILVEAIFAVQWLDFVPSLSMYGFGTAPYALQINHYVITLDLENTVTIFAFLISGILLLNTIVISSVASNYMKKNFASQQLHQAQLEASSADRGVEVLHLVHDIKTPLTTIGGLVSLINLKTDDKQIDEYCTKIQDSIQKLEDMVSEILNENKKNWYTVQELFDYIRASYISKSQFQINVSIPSETVYLWINKIRLSRALANLIDNAIDAIEAVDHGQVTLKAVEKGNHIYIGVTDNGVGMDEGQRQKIWEAGFSTKNHSGIGLSFVQQVANHHDAIIQIETALHSGTTIWLIFEKGDE